MLRNRTAGLTLNMIRHSLLSDITTRLAPISDTPALDASVLIAHIINKPRTWEAAFRYGDRDTNDDIDNDDETEVRGALSYYYRRHALKFQMDYGQVRRGLGASNPDKRKDNELRMQAQFIF